MILSEELLVTILLLAWVIFVVMVLTKHFYKLLRNLGVEHFVAVYYNRKVVHILVGGLCAVIISLLFRTVLLPFIMAMALALFLYLPHKIGRILYWFQTQDNMYEVTFAIMWGRHPFSRMDSL